MSLEPRTIDLEQEFDDLLGEMDEWSDKQSDAPFGSQASKRMEFEARTLENYSNGVAWALDTYGTDITLRPLTDGARRVVRDLTNDTGYDRDQCLIAVGTVDAPFIEHDPESLSPTDEDLKATLANITELHPDFVDWCGEKIQDLGSMGAELGNSYTDMLLKRRAEKANHETTGSDTHE